MTYDRVRSCRGSHGKNGGMPAQMAGTRTKMTRGTWMRWVRFAGGACQGEAAFWLEMTIAEPLALE